MWLHNSGTGEFGYADLECGRFEPVTFCPGYLRGLDFAGEFAVVGLSEPRGERAFAGLALQARICPASGPMRQPGLVEERRISGSS